jgi:hypothetical protein
LLILCIYALQNYHKMNKGWRIVNEWSFFLNNCMFIFCTRSAIWFKDDSWWVNKKMSKSTLFYNFLCKKTFVSIPTQVSSTNWWIMLVIHNHSHLKMCTDDNMYLFSYDRFCVLTIVSIFRRCGKHMLWMRFDLTCFSWRKDNFIKFTWVLVMQFH